MNFNIFNITSVSTEAVSIIFNSSAYVTVYTNYFLHNYETKGHEEFT